MKKPNLNKPAFKAFPEKAKLIQNNQCPTCRGTIVWEDFRDELSKKEFTISGMCQTCQDKTFEPEVF